MADAVFGGFTKGSVKFFRDLAKNNTREWFDAHKDVYEEEVVAPSRAFVVAMGARLKSIAPGVHAYPRVNKSLFRLNRDTRFSKDKSPFKTYFGIMMWEGDGPRMESSSFYFHYEQPNLFVGAGVYQFSDTLLEKYRRACVDAKTGGDLAKAAAKVTKSGDYALGGKTFKRVPRAFAPDHPNAEFLMHGGLYVGVSVKLPSEFYSAGLVDWCLAHYKAALPIHRWLVQLTKS